MALSCCHGNCSDDKIILSVLKGKCHANLLSFQKPQKCLSVSRNNKIIVKFVISYHPSAIEPAVS